ncbi:MAG: hypothetical protein A3E84_02690 [Gammaproteobacteria bacterium RIFCSPHIGHO2_12_FULL_42_13]|nr:MAG: hypothetical protein A3E84_02690 [Gammaproteobacteria bacterium RIFCSPHIGHO2_12_FULL_42_13]
MPRADNRKNTSAHSLPRWHRSNGLPCMTQQIITWDLGATKCAAGLVEYDKITETLTCKTSHSIKLSDATSLEDLITQLETKLGLTMHDADAICIGGAGYYDGKSLLLDGAYPYPMLFAEIAHKQQWPSYAVIHDYAPIVCATFTSYMEQPHNIKRLNTCQISKHGRRVAFGIGTSLGLKDGVLLPSGDFWLGQNEMGHIGITMPPLASQQQLQRHQEIMRFLANNPHEPSHHALTFEKILSGKGMVRLYQFFHPNEQAITPEQVGMKMRNSQADETLDAFAWYVGLFIGTVQLIFMPKGGIWVTGGVALHHTEAFDRPELMDGIYASPAYLAQRETYPLGVLCNLEHALIGGAYYATKRLLSK